MKHIIAALFFSLSPQFAHADCGPQWLFNDGLRGSNADVLCSVVWDPDGSGPRTPLLVIGGEFSVAGNQLASNIVTWDPSTGEWSPLGAGTDGDVLALAANDQGELFVGGSFLHAGGLSAPGIARWNGTTWSGLGSGVGGAEPVVHSLAVAPNGDVYAGGEFQSAGGIAANSIARWSGNAWSPMSTGLKGDVLTLAVLANGDLMAAGSFLRNGDDVLVRNIARWNGTTWNALSGGGLNSTIRKLAVHPNGQVVAVGSFLLAGGKTANRIAAWNGTTWDVFGSGFTGGFSDLGNTAWVRSVIVLANGDIVAGGAFYVPGNPVANSLYRWNGTSWQVYGGTIGGDRDTGQVLTLTEMPDGSLFAGGEFMAAGGNPSSRMARLQNGSWKNLGEGMDRPALTLLSLPNGDLFAGGYITTAGGVAAHAIARWDGRDWHALSGGMTENTEALAPPSVMAICRMPNGDIIAGGRFLKAGGTTVGSIARWDGSQWSGIGGGLSGTTFTNQGTFADALAVLPNGDLVVGGQFDTAGSTPAVGLARFDGVQWHTLAGGTPDGLVKALAVLPNGDLVAGGEFINIGALKVDRIARWNGSAWSSIGGGVVGDSFVGALAVTPDGQILAGGKFSIIGASRSIARWDGSKWQPLGLGLNEYGIVNAIAVMPNSDVIIAGDFSEVDRKPISNIARWNGADWNPMQAGIEGPVAALCVRENGELVAAGDFARAGSRAAGHWARWSDTGTPTTVEQPADQAEDAGQTVSFSAAPTDGYETTSFRWLRNGHPVSEGSQGASIRGGVAIGAAGSFHSPTLDSRTTLTITNVRPSDAGQFSVEFQNSCGTVASAAAILSVVNICPADLDGDGFISDPDLHLFASDYDNLFCAEPSMPEFCLSDFNHDGQVDDSDFVQFAYAYDGMVCP